MKILMVNFGKIRYTPYIDFYFKTIDCVNNQVDCLYWNRDLVPEEIPYKNVNFYEFRASQKDEVKKYKKIKNFIKIRSFIREFLKQKYDRVIILYSLTGVLFWFSLLRWYKGKFVFDFRDITYEHNSIYRWFIGSLVKNSQFTTVSSDKFRTVLPESCQNKIFTNHNISFSSLVHRNKEHMPKDSVVRISFWGFNREGVLNAEFIKKVAADKRFELHYYGREEKVAQSLKALAKEINADNVFFHGEYKQEERYEFVKNTDIIHNVYGQSKNMMLAMSNKFYDGPIFYLPQLCMEGSFMGEVAEKEKIGISCNPYKDDFLDKVYEYYAHLNREEFNSNCDRYLDKCLKEVEVIKKKLEF